MKSKSLNTINELIGSNMAEKSEKDVTFTIGSEPGRVYNYDEAMDLTGNGWYNIGLTMAMSLSCLAMAVDMFSFSLIVTLCSCEFNLELRQKTILITMPFIGPIAMAYLWGYIADTQGRRKTLFIATCIAFIVAGLSAFSPNWITMAILKLICTSCSSCAQSVSCTFLGESCPKKAGGGYLLAMSGFIHMGQATGYAFALFITQMDFSYDLGLINFTPWRFLTLVLALPLGLSALSLMFFEESPKFLINAGKEDEAVKAFRAICRRNGGDLDNYPVKNVVLEETGNFKQQEHRSLLESIWEQIAPLFRPPYLFNAMLIYYIFFVIFCSCSCLYVYLPFISDAFTLAVSPEYTGKQGFVHMTEFAMNANETSHAVKCTAQLPVALISITCGTVFMILNLILARFAAHKKSLLIFCLAVGAFSALGLVLIPSNAASFVLYFGVSFGALVNGAVFTYCGDLFPTSVRGMAACIGVMVGRLSSLVGVHLVGPYLLTNTDIAFYSLAGLLISGIIVACFLPPDNPKKIV